jgi:tetratricopeptide (TPR) repeat protein
MLERDGEVHAVSAGHARWAVDVAERAAVGLRGGEEPRWAGLIRTHLDDCRLAHAWLTGHDPTGAVRLAAALRTYALWRGASEVLRWAETAAAAASATPSAHLSEALLAAATGGWQRGDAMAADACARAAVAAGAGLYRRPGLEATADVALMTGDLEVASAYFEEAAAIAVDEGDDLQATWDIGSAAIAHAYAGRYEHALRLADETDDIARRCDAPSGFAFASYVRGEIVADRDAALAVRLLDAAVAHSGAAGTTFVASLAEVTLASIRSGDDTDQAAHHCRSALRDWRRAGAWTPLWVTMRTAAQLLVRAGRRHDAAVITSSLNSSSGRAYPAFGRDSERLSELELTLRQELGAQTFEEANARGAAMSAEETVSFALHSLRLVSGSNATG